MKYPKVDRGDHVDVLHGETVADPYRWLEDPDSNETKAFVKSQNECTEQLFRTIPHRKEIRDRMTDLYNYEKYSCPRQRAGRYFYYKNDGLQNQSVLYMQKESLTSESTVLLDPNTLSDDGTAALSATAFSEYKLKENLYFAYGVSRGGSDWQTIKVIDVLNDGKELTDCVQWVKFTAIAWMHDDSGFFYSRFPAPEGLQDSNPNDQDSKLGTETGTNINHQIWFHRLGEDQQKDVLVYAYPEEPKYYISAEVSDDGKYLIIYLRDGCKNASMVHVADISQFHEWSKKEKANECIAVKKVVDTMEASYDFILNNGTEFYFQTNLNAPRDRIVKCDILQETMEWHEVIAEPEGKIVLQGAIAAGEKYLLVKLLEDVKDVLKIYTIDGNYIQDISLPSAGSLYLTAKRHQNEVFFKFISFLYPGTIYQYDLGQLDKAPEIYRETKVKGFNASDYETKQVFYSSKDGTKIPMFLVGKKNIPLTGMNPVYLYGYGGFNISIKPSFSIFRLIFIQHFNGLLAFPNLRGGGEYGEEWHQLGTFDKKQNVFDDFHAAAEYLIAQEYTCPSKIAIHGGSNGGLLVTACANQRPELYACAVAAVGVLDMLRFHKFTCGHGWRTDYGDPDISSNYQYLKAYSPLHNIPKAGYPSLLLTTGDHDDRVVPLHSFKFIAEIQYQLGQVSTQEKHPLLIRIETNAGHGAGKPTEKIIEEYADVYAFIAWSLGQDYH